MPRKKTKPRVFRSMEDFEKRYFPKDYAKRQSEFDSDKWFDIRPDLKETLQSIKKVISQ